MPLEHGKNAFKLPDDRSHWYNNPKDEGALKRLYPDLTYPAPYYQYPVLVRDSGDYLVQSSNFKEFKRFYDEFIALSMHVEKLCAALKVNPVVTPKDKPPYNVIHQFTDNILCGFTGQVSSKFSHQADPTLFAEIKENYEIIINAMLKAPDKAKPLLQRLNYSINVCEGGVWADLQTIARELTPTSGLFEMLHHIHLKQVNEIARLHALEHKKLFDKYPGHETHVNVFMQTLFSLLGKIKKPVIRDVNVPTIGRNAGAGNKIIFTSSGMAYFAQAGYMIKAEDLVEFENIFDAMCTPETDIENIATYLDEQIVNIFHEYEKTIKSAVRTTGLSLGEYMESMNNNERSAIMNSLVDARAKCIEDINSLLHSFDAVKELHHLFIDDDLLVTKKPLTLKNRTERLKWCRAIAANSLRKNEAITGFALENISDQYRLMKDSRYDCIINAEGSFISPFDYVFEVETLPPSLIENASLMMLIALKKAIKNYRDIMIDAAAFAESMREIDLRLRALKPEHNANCLFNKHHYIIEDEHDVMDIFNLGELYVLCKSADNITFIHQLIAAKKLTDSAFLKEFLTITDKMAQMPNGRSGYSVVSDLLFSVFGFHSSAFLQNPSRALVYNELNDDLIDLNARVNWAAHVNRRSNDGKSPLVMALERDDVPEIKRLLAHKDIGLSLLQDDVIKRLVKYAVESDCFDMLVSIISACPSDDICKYMLESKQIPFVMFLVRTSQPRTLAYMAKYIKNINQNYTITIDSVQYIVPLICVAAINCWDDVVDNCLNRDDINYKGPFTGGNPSPLNFAVQFGLTSFIDKIKAHKKFYTDLDTALYRAIKYEQQGCIAHLLPDIRKDFVLHSFLREMNWLVPDAVLASIINLGVSIEGNKYPNNRTDTDALRWAIGMKLPQTTAAIVESIKHSKSDPATYLVEVAAENWTPLVNGQRNPCVPFLVDYNLLFNSPSLHLICAAHQFDSLCEYAGIESDSIQALKLWAQSTVCRINAEMSARKLIQLADPEASNTKVLSLQQGISNDDAVAMMDALQLKRKTSMFWSIADSTSRMPEKLGNKFIQRQE